MKRIVYLMILLLISSFSFAQNGEFTQLTYKCGDGKERPFIVYTPNSLEKSKTNPLLVFLHGGISSLSLKKDPLEYMQKSELLNLADKGNFYLMFSYGQKGATWFDAVGTDMVLGEVAVVKNKFNINKIFLSGFSDGGSGVFYMAMTSPFPFAGFIAMNGSIAVAQKLGEKEMFPENTNHIPMYIINTTKDILYPMGQIQPTIEYLKKFNPNITFKTPNAKHDMSYLEKEKDNLIRFIHDSKPMQWNNFTWETKPTKESILYFNDIKVDTTQSNKKWHQVYELRAFNRKAKFGLKFDYSYRGKGLKVAGFKYDNCTAQKMGVKVNDIILKMENDSIKSPYAPFYYLMKKRAGDSTSLTLLRDSEEKTINGKFNDGFYYKVLRSSNQSGKIKAEIKDKKLKINTSRIAAFNINFEALKPFKVRKVYLNNQPLKIKRRGEVTVKVQ